MKAPSNRVLVVWPREPLRNAVVGFLRGLRWEAEVVDVGIDAPYSLRAGDREHGVCLLVVRIDKRPRLGFAILEHGRRSLPTLPIAAVVDERRSWIGSEVERLGADWVIDIRSVDDELRAIVEAAASVYPLRMRANAKPIRTLSSRLRIALAEDDVEMRRFVAGALRRDGHEVIEARTGIELLDVLSEPIDRALARPRVDVIISDLRMPDMTGLEVRSRLRGAHPATPFILMTAFGGVEIRREAEAVGAAAVLDKPFELSALRATIAAVIGSVA